MNPSRHSSCKRLLRGVKLLAARNAARIVVISAKLRALQVKMHKLSLIVTEAKFADGQILLPMSRRIALASTDIKSLRSQLDQLSFERTRLENAKSILISRLKKIETEQAEYEQSEVILMACEQRVCNQAAARKAS
jgi:hypothetical protein